MAVTAVLGMTPNRLSVVETVNPIGEVQPSIRNYRVVGDVNYIATFDVIENLPFRVSFLEVQRDIAYGRQTPAPIGVAIIGYSNFII